MNNSRITYVARPATSPEDEISALRNVYSFVIQSSRAKRKDHGSKGTDNDERQERR